jgi:hypothetical protein
VWLSWRSSRSGATGRKVPYATGRDTTVTAVRPRVRKFAPRTYPTGTTRQTAGSMNVNGSELLFPTNAVDAYQPAGVLAGRPGGPTIDGSAGRSTSVSCPHTGGTRTGAAVGRGDGDPAGTAA